MNRLLRCAFLLAVAATPTACNRAPDSLPSSSAAARAISGAPGAIASTPSTPRPIAGAPNVGSLFAFAPGVGPVVPTGRDVPVTLSEAHALAGIAGKEISLPDTQGGQVQLRYRRHIEHPDGNWSWVGDIEDGGSAVVTFGERAVFGTVRRADGTTLRIDTHSGRTWVTRIAPGMFADGKPGTTDEVLPPKSAAGESSETAEAATAERASPGTGATIDMVVGYTNGLAAYLGGESQATTRANNYIDVTNDAYERSGITHRVRLVRTVLVNYPDATDNGDALAQLTGYDSTTNSSIAIDPAFAVLRAERDHYGGDLVTLMRRFSTPENNGCGIAWLIGGNLQGIDATDDDWGYSVVSVGSDQDLTGAKYYCRDETLAHEIGHNLGQTHNSEDASEPGVHPYSYGYRESSTSGFYTIMAYRISPQVAIPYFANPTVLYEGRTTGNASTADNVRSMQQTIPTIAQFRAQVVPNGRTAPSDINNDGRSDILWRMGPDIAYWSMNGGQIQSSNYAGSGGAGFTLMTTGDFNDDGAGDFVFSNGSTLRFLINNGNGTAFSVGSSPAGGSWQPFSAIDMTGDGRSDLVWRLNSQVAFWAMNGSTVQYSSYAGDGLPGFKAMCVADFNGDGAGDLVFSNGSQLRVWVNNGAGTGFTSSTFAAAGDWQPFTAGDINGDGKGDLIFRFGSQVAYWVMNGNALVSTHYLGDGGAGYRVVTVSDFTGDGAGDLVFSNGSTLKIWVNNGNGTGWTVTTQPGAGSWQMFDPNIVE